ncbi:kinase-like domain-containing protein [Rhizophagus irregularis DAOM 181602=DAOM 197198]|nr:kinase-like domain-containing protein [Rhizophagus irregularis DAOM 181602=DAOM 197198]
MVPYVDPKIFNRRNNNQTTQIYSLNEKSVVYSIDVLLWEISSGQPPFYVEGQEYDVGLALEILQGLRETVVPDTPENYLKIYTKCWDGEPDNRPTIYQVIDWRINSTYSNFNKINTKEINSIAAVPSKQENLSTEKDFNIEIDKINEFISKILNKGLELKLVKQQVIKYFNDYDINSREIYNWLLNNQITSNSIFILGFFNFYGIVIKYFVGYCYRYGYGIIKDEKLAFKYYEKVASNENYIMGQLEIGYCYENGIAIKKDYKNAFCWYEKAPNKGNIMAIYNLGRCYLNGKGFCYNNGIGTNINRQKAIELYEKSANLGNKLAKYNLALMYEHEDGITKDTYK